MKRGHRHLALLLGSLALLAVFLLAPRRDYGRRPARAPAPAVAQAPGAAEPAPAWPPKEKPPVPHKKPQGPNPLDGLVRGISALPGGPEGSYVLREQDASVFFSEEGVSLAMAGASLPSAGPAERRVHAVRWSPVGAAAVKPRPVDEMPGKIHSFVGDASRWIQDGSMYRAVEYDQIAPGVDLRVEARSRAVKYTLEARQARDLDGLQFRYDGTDEVRVVDDGRAVEIQTPAGTVREDGLVCWQDVDGARRPVEARYRAAGGNVYEISIDGADPDAPLTVDPVIGWSSYLGGTLSGLGEDYGQAIAVDSTGNMFVAGYTYSVDLPVGGSYSNVLNVAGQFDAFLIKLTAAGAFSWGTYYGGTGGDYFNAVAVDAGGDAYVTGYTSSSDFPVTAGAFDTTPNSYESFVVRFGSGGNRLWATFFGGTSTDYGYAIAVDGTGVYIGGYTYSSAGFPLTGAFDATYGPNQDGYVAKLNLAGTGVIYSSYVGGSGYDYVQGIAVNAGGECFVTGYTDSTDFNQAPGPYPVYGGSTSDAFLLKVRATGTLAWSTYLGGNASDYGTGVTVTNDPTPDPVVVGYTNSSTFPVTAGAFDITLNGQEAFVARIKDDGSGPVFSTFLGGTSTDYGQAIAPGAAGSVYVTGRTSGSTFPFTLGAFRTSSFGGYDIFVSQLSSTGSLLASTYAGGSSTDYGLGIATVLGGGNAGVFVGGRTVSTDFGSTALSRPDSILGGTTDACATKLNLILTSSPWATYVGGNNAVADNQAYDAAVDAAGSVFVVGQTNAFNFPVFPAPPTSLDPVPGIGGAQDVFVTKISTNAGGIPTIAWSTYLGGSSYDYGSAIAVDNTGFALVTGYTISSDFPLATPDDGTLGSYDAFVTYIDSTGALYRSTFLGGNSTDYGRSITCDSSLNVYVTGQTYSADFPWTAGAFDSTLSVTPDGFVAKYSPTGVKLWASYFGGNDTDYPAVIASDNAGNVYITGYTYSTDFVAGGAGPDPTFNGLFDAFVMKVNTAGALQWSRYLGGTNYEQGYCIDVEPAGTAVVVVGYTGSSDFPLLLPMDNTLSSYDAFITRLNPATGDLVWSTFLGGSSTDYAQAVELDAGGNAYVVGWTYSSNFPMKGAFDSSFNGFTDAWVAKIYADGQSLAWSSYLGGSNYDYGYGVSRDGAGNVFVTGSTQSSDFPLLNAVDAGMNSYYEAFIVRLVNAPPAAPDFAAPGAGQFRTGNGAAISAGGWTNESTFTVKAKLDDTDDEPLRLEVQLKPLGVAFTDPDPGATTTEALPGGAAGTLHTLQVTLPGPSPAQYHWRARTRDAANNTSASWVVFGGTADINTRDIGYDTQAPAPLITAPGAPPSFYTTASSIGVSGTVSDAASGTTSVSWSNAGPPFASGGATFTPPGPNWSVASISLVANANLITISATDLAGNTGTSQITIYRDNTAPSTVNITDPATDPFIVAVNSRTLTVNTVDNLLIASVGWVNNRGGSGSGSLASGTAQSGNWSVPVTGLSPGLNIITVTAYDGAGNSQYDTITLNYDNAPPSLAIGSPTSGLVTSAGTINVSGTASDTGLLSTITWSNPNVPSSGGVSPPLSPAWSVNNIPLSAAGTGVNQIQFTATDSVSLSTNQTVTVYRDNTLPTITSVTSPPTSPFITGSSSISVQGTAADNLGVASVQIRNVNTNTTVSATLGTPGGTSTTFVGPALSLVANTNNTIEITARDLVTAPPGGNASLVTTITVYYDTNGPTLVVNSPPPSPFVTNVGSIALSGTCADNSQVTSFTCTKTVGAVTTPVTVVTVPASLPTASLTWSTTVTLDPGTNTITFTAQDDVPVTPLTTTVVLTVIYDPSAPTVKVTGPTTADDFFTGTSTLALSGISTDNRGTTLVTWSTDGAVAPNAGTASGTSSWSIASINLANGVQTITITAQDEAGNSSTDTLLVTRDPTAPTLFITVPTVGDTFTTNASSTPLQGTASDAVGVTKVTWSNAANGSSGTATGTNSWSVASVNLAAGSNPITVMAFDAAGNLMTDTLIVYRDTANPAGAITFPSASPYVTNTGTLQLAGTASDDIGVASVTYTNNGGAAQAVLGTTSWTANVTLVNGNNVIAVTVTDGFGNTSVLTPITVTVHYDAALPTVSITDPDAVADAATNTASSPVVLGGSVADLNGAGAAAPAQVAWANLSTGGVGSCTVIAGAWSASIPLTAGANSIQVTATDAAGNSASALFTATYDTAAPAVTILTPTPDLTYASAASPLLFAGTASDDVGLASVAWTTSGAVATNAGNAMGTANWSFSVDLSDGANLITVTATDVVGRTTTARITVTYDPTPPAVAVTSPTSESLFQSTTTPFSLGGQATDNLEIQSVTWINNTTGEVGTATGTAIWAIGSITLVAGLNDIAITATDGVGNTGTTSVLVDYDGLPPVIAIDAAWLTPNPYATTTRPLPVTGTASDDQNLVSVTWTNSRGGGGTAALGSGTWTAPVYLYPSPPDNVITFTAMDAHGQVAMASMTVTYTPESNAPSIDITTPVVTSSASQVVTIGGVASDNPGVVSVIWRNLTTGVQGPATDTGTAFSTWSADVPLTAGSNVIRATAYDDVGNTAVDTITIVYTAPADTVAPAVDITGPTVLNVWDETVSPMLITVSAVDTGGSGVASVSWTNGGTGGGGTGTPGLGTVWTADVALAFGTNVITVTATDAGGNTATDTLIVNFIPAPGDSSNPTVTIVPAPTGTVNVSVAPYALAGTSSDNVMVTTVVWSNAANGTTGSADGTTTWALGVTLEPGINVITVKAYDSSALVDTDSITVLYTPPPPPPEVVPAGSCGLTGIDALLLLAGVAAWRRRRSR